MNCAATDSIDQLEEKIEAIERRILLH